MAIPKHVIKHLESKRAKYIHVPHRTVYTAYDAAQTLRRKLDEIAKNVLVKTNGGWALIIIPASKNIDFKKLKLAMQKAGKAITNIKIPNEKEMAKFLEIVPGALPAFGSLHDLEVYMDRTFLKLKKAVFSTGSFEDSVEMATKEFVKLENALLGAFSVPKKLPKPVKVAVKKVKRVSKKKRK